MLFGLVGSPVTNRTVTEPSGLGMAVTLLTV